MKASNAKNCGKVRRPLVKQGVIGVNSLGSLVESKSSPFDSRKPCRINKHTWLEGTDNWVCSRCGTAKSKADHAFETQPSGERILKWRVSHVKMSHGEATTLAATEGRASSPGMGAVAVIGEARLATSY